MSTITVGSHAHDDGHSAGHGHTASFVSKYIFSKDHKVIGIQFLFSTLLWFLVGGLLALGVRFQVAWPWDNMPVIGKMLFANQGGQISPDFYTVLFTMHATVMIFFVIIPILAGAFGNFLIPLMIGADDMAFPTLNMLSYWFMWPAFFCIGGSFFVAGGAAKAGWTSYPPLSLTDLNGQNLWLTGVTFVGISSMMGSINYMTTIIQMRAPGMTMFRLPMTIWAMFITAILQAFALPVLTAAGFMQLMDRLLGTGFFIPEGWSANNTPMASGGGQPLLWQHLFWFYSHPAVYIMILPAMGMVSDIISCFARKPLFGYKPMVFSIAGIAGLGFIVWGHHMFISGMNPALGMTFMVSTMMIALPSAIKTFNWLGTIWGGKIQYTTAMLFALAFVSMFIIGGLSGIFMAATPVDIFIHDTYFIVAHFHYVLFAGTAMGVFGAIYFWFPKMFGRTMNEFWGKVHFFLTFIFLNGTFFPMHILGAAGFPRRLADPYHYPGFHHLQGLNIFITWCAIGMVASQIIFAINFIYSIFFGPIAGRNPWHANGLEWTAPSPPGHGNFDYQPVVYRGPYEYGSPEVASDFYPQIQPPPPDTGHTPPGAPRRPIKSFGERISGIFMLPSAQPSASAWPHRWAVLLVCATFPLIWIGGLVTTYKAGMAVPDWPNTYGYNLFLYPWQTWINGPWDLFIEHGHRLWGASVGMLTIALVVSVWRNDGRRWMRACSLAALAAVIFQGLLGGMRVRMDEILLARIHGCFGPAFFAFATALAVCTSPWWRAADGVSRVPGASQAPQVSGRLARLAGVTALLVYVQLVLGSLLRHVPSGTGPLAFRMAVWAHLLMAAVVSVHVVLLALKSWRLHLAGGLLTRPVYGLVGLLIAQLSLGVGTWVVKYGWPAWFANSSVANSSWLSSGDLLGFTVTAGSRLQAWVATLHVAIGSLILATAVMTTLRLARAAHPVGGAPDAARSQTSLDLEPRSGVERPVAERQVWEAVA